MGWAIVLPALTAVAVGIAAGRLQRHLSPAIATVAFTTLAALASVAVTGAVLVLAALFVAQLPLVAGNVPGLRTLTAHHTLPEWLGFVLVAGSLAMALSVVRTVPRRLRLPSMDAELVVLSDSAPAAYAVPGRPGHIVVSAGMLRLLDEDERRVLLAHERAHLRLRHHVYVRIADVAAGAVPVLRPLRDRVRFATERWADEAAVADVGDRTVVARAICRAALAGAPRGALAMATLGVPDRLEALLDDDASRAHRWATTTSVVGAVVVVAVSSTLQLRLVAAFAAHAYGVA